jgi:hypothetical protein
MTLSIKGSFAALCKNETHSINDIQHNNNTIWLGVVVLSLTFYLFAMLNVFTLSDVMLNVVNLCAVMLNVVILSAVIQNVIMLSVVAPFQ